MWFWQLRLVVEARDHCFSQYHWSVRLEPSGSASLLDLGIVRMSQRQLMLDLKELRGTNRRHGGADLLVIFLPQVEPVLGILQKLLTLDLGIVELKSPPGWLSRGSNCLKPV